MNNTPSLHYCGRFAPSPTGPLHFGSLVAALGSYLRARSQHGRWLLRIEDIDPLREIAGASDAIIRCLDSYGFEWDGPIRFQHSRQDAYHAAIEQMAALGLVFNCGCTRSELSGHTIYPGHCRHGLAAGKSARSIRVRVECDELGFDDLLQGDYRQQLRREVGDFIIKRAEGFIAYQLAVVVDDADQGITEIVRGFDLIDNTPRQIYLQQLLGVPTPHYLHLPIATNSNGDKLSKQTYAPPLDMANPVPALHSALSFLGQQPPAELRRATLPELWHWAFQHGSLDKVPKRQAIAIPAITQAS